EMAPVPNLPDTLACVQSQAALLPVAPPSELAQIRYRKGYCALSGATVTKNPADYREAAREFDKAVEAMPAGGTAPSGLRTLAAIAHLRAGETDDPRVKAELASAMGQAACASGAISAETCRALAGAGRLWLGWLAAWNGKLAEAAELFKPFPDSGWDSWVAGLRATATRHPAEAAGALERAVQIWIRDEKYPKPGFVARILPVPDLAEAQYQLGAARFLARDYAAAIQSLDGAIRARPDDARAIYLRGQAKEMLGQPALVDYELASRVAFASTRSPAAGGQAHFYRGVWLFGRRQYDLAEEQFASALNFGPGEALRPDVAAWWRMAAVASGACQASAAYLEQALHSVSDFFPKPQAESLLHSCRSTARISMDAAPAAR
ncbi:MAG: hypothetical protein M1436_09555, partial [Acidobacteria bacterium]|nr:hypothetical protein [Acidobacteriota bacterium]